MAKIEWVKGEVPNNLEVKQIYGICFTKEGQVLLRIENGKYKLTGGKPDKEDLNRNETLKREFLEEVNTVIEEPIIVGYQLVDEEDGSKKYAQVRMAAMIKSINEARPDPDRKGKWIYGRCIVTPKKAAELLNWGYIGIAQITDAWRIMQKKYKLQTKKVDYQLINEESFSN